MASTLHLPEKNSKEKQTNTKQIEYINIESQGIQSPSTKTTEA